MVMEQDSSHASDHRSPESVKPLDNLDGKSGHLTLSSERSGCFYLKSDPFLCLNLKKSSAKRSHNIKLNIEPKESQVATQRNAKLQQIAVCRNVHYQLLICN